eukprot:m.75428 g.75428  ORF g.75428 m.75428 type:complete len:359 (+) comp14481_c0_seq2:313-1389(+)
MTLRTVPDAKRGGQQLQANDIHGLIRFRNRDSITNIIGFSDEEKDKTVEKVFGRVRKDKGKCKERRRQADHKVCDLSLIEHDNEGKQEHKYNAAVKKRPESNNDRVQVGKRAGQVTTVAVQRQTSLLQLCLVQLLGFVRVKHFQAGKIQLLVVIAGLPKPLHVDQPRFLVGKRRMQHITQPNSSRAALQLNFVVTHSQEIVLDKIGVEVLVLEVVLLKLVWFRVSGATVHFFVFFWFLVFRCWVARRIVSLGGAAGFVGHNLSEKGTKPNGRMQLLEQRWRPPSSVVPLPGSTEHARVSRLSKGPQDKPRTQRVLNLVVEGKRFAFQGSRHQDPAAQNQKHGKHNVHPEKPRNPPSLL